MNKYADKICIFFLCAAAYTQYRTDIYLIVPVICVVIISALMSYVEKPVFVLPAFLACCAVSAVYPAFLFFLPLLCYDVFSPELKFWPLAGVIPAVAGFYVLPFSPWAFILICTAVSCVLKQRTVSYEAMKKEYTALRDETKEFALQLERKNKELMEKQDYEVNLATLNERNRIARDIHDSIGHLLSSSILQTAALMAVCRDESVREKLSVLKDTLSVGMDSVRSSIHGLYDDSVDLYTEIKTLADSFDFCAISFDCDIEGNPEKEVRYALIYVAKEALTNVIRHSDATEVWLTLTEHPGLYQLIVKDNGSEKKMSGEGIGLRNIRQRVESLGGIANIGYKDGFTVFISIPKERKE